jgi:hypothetical protein
MTNQQELPSKIVFPNLFDSTLPPTEMKAIGLGEFPYDCRAKSLRPDAMVYYGESSWIDSGDKNFDKRLKELDEF